jgi:hypothetical protein
MRNKKETREFFYCSFKKNRRADIPVTILVLGVLAVCGLAMLSFYLPVKFSSDSFQNNMEVLNEVKLYAQQASFYTNPKINQKSEDLLEFFSGEIANGNTIFSGRIENGIYTIEGKRSERKYGFLPPKYYFEEVFSVRYSFRP